MFRYGLQRILPGPEIVFFSGQMIAGVRKGELVELVGHAPEVVWMTVGENDVRERQQWIADKRAFGKFVKKFAIPDLTQLKQEIEDNYKIYGKTTKD